MVNWFNQMWWLMSNLVKLRYSLIAEKLLRWNYWNCVFTIFPNHFFILDLLHLLSSLAVHLRLLLTYPVLSQSRWLDPSLYFLLHSSSYPSCFFPFIFLSFSPSFFPFSLSLYPPFSSPLLLPSSSIAVLHLMQKAIHLCRVKEVWRWRSDESTTRVFTTW